MPVSGITSTRETNFVEGAAAARAQGVAFTGLAPAANQEAAIGRAAGESGGVLGQAPASGSGVTVQLRPAASEKTLYYDALEQLPPERTDEKVLLGSAVAGCIECLEAAPTSAADAAALQENIDVYQSILKHIEENTPNLETRDPEQYAALRQTAADLQARKDYLEDFKASDNTTKTAVAKMRQDWVDSALGWARANLPEGDAYCRDTIAMLEARSNALGDVHDDTPHVTPGLGQSDKDVQKTYKNALESLAGKKRLDRSEAKAEKGALANQIRERNIPLFGSKMTEERIVTEVLKDACKHAGIDPKHVAHGVRQHHMELLGGRMTSVTKQISCHTPLGMANFSSKMVPAREFGETPVVHDFGTRGVVCHQTREADHAKNLWTSSLVTPDGRTLFTGVRHGVHSAYGFNVRDVRKMPKDELASAVKELLPHDQWVSKNGRADLDATVKACRSYFSIKGMRLRTEMRETANLARAKEMLAGALANNPKVLEAVKAGENPVLTVSSLSLLTPDRLRSGFNFFGKLEANSEKRMLREQVAALRMAAAKGLEVNVKGDDGSEFAVHVPVELRTFNFGVNMGAFAPTGTKWLVSGWDFANKHANNEAMQSLIGKNKVGELGGDVGDYLARNDISAEARNEVRVLAEQVRDLWNTKAYQQGKVDPYAMVSRLALLTNRLGHSTAYNCKSGKDRTGEMDAETKFLALRIELSGQVPEPGVPLTDSEKALFRTVAFSTGNLEVQRMNTGGGGYKLEGVNAITERLGGMAAKMTHRGLSKFTAS